MEDGKQAVSHCRSVSVYEAGFSPLCPMLSPLILNDTIPEEHVYRFDSGVLQ